MELFDCYDSNGDGMLSKTEIRLMASHCIARILSELCIRLHQQQPTWSESRVIAKALEERIYCLPHGNIAKTNDDFERAMVRLLNRNLIVGRAARVTRAAFAVNANRVFSRIFSVNIDGQAHSSFSCAIM